MMDTFSSDAALKGLAVGMQGGRIGEEQAGGVGCYREQYLGGLQWWP